MGNMKDIAPNQSARQSEITAKLIERAKALRPVLKERAAGTEALGMVDPRTVADFQEAGFFRMFQSSYWGGYESHPADIFRVQEILAQGCPSSAWIMGVVGVHNWQLAHFSKKAQEDVWGKDSTVLASSSYAPTGKAEMQDGGLMLSGRWFYSSGVDHCDWVLLGAAIQTEDSPFPDYRTCLVPRSDVEIVEDWNVMGLKGTGSKSVQLKGAFVPDYRQLPIIASQTFTTPGLQDGTAKAPLFLVPFPTIFGACITTPALGAAQGLLDIFIENTKNATSLYTGARWAEEQATQIRIAESAAELRAARLQMAANFNQVIDALSSGEELSLEERARIRFDHTNLVELAARAADRVFVASGARSLVTDQPIQRLFRDIQAARVHAINNRTKWATVSGQAELGIFPEDMLSMFI
ncbi:MAG: flavin-dependent monooxygenase [Burkholderiales bacterium]|jgi:3-hydroxy-9,10-secoandrosta-1,3,5(10)-triene-9,17-dione monooxygenase|nr:MAG: flavin-dependent monooxygenase [Burkholderiales bacterium]